MTLDQIALRAKTDKASDGHNYTPVYASYLEKHRQDPLLIFELGIGGYQYPDRGGQSLRMWYEYFPKATIVGIDLHHKAGLSNDRTHIVQGSQDDAALMASLVEKYGAPDLVIDDASHQCPLTIRSFEVLFPLLKPGGLYFCEDVHVSFWNEYQGDPNPDSTKPTTVNFFRSLTPQLSHDTLHPDTRNAYAGYLDFIHFYRNLVIVKKL